MEELLKKVIVAANHLYDYFSSMSINMTLLISILAAVLAAYLTRANKIAEFRQAWINDLRKDIADYIGAARKWHRAYEIFYAHPDDDKEQKARLFSEHYSISTDALVILHRIRLRFKPNPKPRDQSDVEFLESLAALLNPAKISPEGMAETNWMKLADDANRKAQVVLKREWDVTKRSWFR